MRTLVGLVLALVAVAAEAAPVGPLSFFLVEPCRMVDTRTGGYPIYPTNYSPVGAATGGLVFFVVKENPTINKWCGVPREARALAVNVTATEATAEGHLTLWDYSASALGPPPTSNLNFSPGKTVANFAIVPLADTASIDMAAYVVINAGARVDLLLDVVGYFR